MAVAVAASGHNGWYYFDILLESPQIAPSLHFK